MNTRVLLQILTFLLGIIVVGFAHIAATYLFPWPFSTIHSIFIALVMIIFLYEHGSVVWFAAILFLCLDFVSLYPFGLVTICGVIATTVMLLLYRHVFTNRSLLAAVALLAIGYTTYRMGYILYHLAQALFTDQSLDLFVDLQVYGIELLCTTGALTIVYVIASRVSYQLQHTTIQESWFRTLQRGE